MLNEGYMGVFNIEVYFESPIVEFHVFQRNSQSSMNFLRAVKLWLAVKNFQERVFRPSEIREVKVAKTESV